MERQTLQKLTEHESMHLKELLPADVPNNLFSYHLQKLLRVGLIERQTGIYKLTVSGRRLAGQINVDTGLPRPQPKIVVMFYIKNSDNQIALFTWKRQPYYGYTSLPYGKIDAGQTLDQNVKDELFKKTGLETNLVHKGDFYMTIREEGQILSHMLVHLYAGSSNGVLQSRVRTGTAFWGSFQEPQLKYMPGVMDAQSIAEQTRNSSLDDYQYHL